jgi:hypothetical protein
MLCSTYTCTCIQCSVCYICSCEITAMLVTAKTETGVNVTAMFVTVIRVTVIEITVKCTFFSPPSRVVFLVASLSFTRRFSSSRHLEGWMCSTRTLMSLRSTRPFTCSVHKHTSTVHNVHTRSHPVHATHTVCRTSSMHATEATAQRTHQCKLQSA